MAATEPRAIREGAKLMVVESSRHSFRHVRMTDLPEFLSPGDLLVLNDAATLPASLPASTYAGDRVEVRLLRQEHDSGGRRPCLVKATGGPRLSCGKRQQWYRLATGCELRTILSWRSSGFHATRNASSRCVSIATCRGCGLESMPTGVRFNMRI